MVPFVFWDKGEILPTKMLHYKHLKLRSLKPPNFNPLLNFGGEFRGLEMVLFNKIKVKFGQQKW